MRVGDRSHLRAFEVLQIEDVFDPHHAAADDAVSDGFHDVILAEEEPYDRTMTENLVDAAPRNLGMSDITVGPIAFGCWRLVGMSVTAARANVETALAAGMNLIDNADVYGLNWGGSGFGEAEELLGKVLTDAPHLREQIVLATKGGINPPKPYDSSVDYLIEACDDSLRRLNVDVIDLYQIHRPDMLTHPGEAREAPHRRETTP